MKIRKGIALGLILVLMTSLLSGCLPLLLLNEKQASGGTAGQSSGKYHWNDEEEEKEEEEEPEKQDGEPGGTISAGGSYFQTVYHGDVHFEDMAYEHYDPTEYEEAIAQLYRLAEKGGAPGSFEKLNSQVQEELYYVTTLYNIAQINYSRNPTDAAVSEELLYTEDICMTMQDEYWSAMQAVASSSYSGLMQDSYDDWQVSGFAQYTDSSALNSLYSRESGLEQQYYSLMAEETVDYDAILDLFVELVNLRSEIAEKSGYKNYAEYAYSGIYARDYSPEESRAIWDAAKEYFVPVMEKYGFAASSGVYLLQTSDEIDCDSDTILQKVNEILPEISDEAYEAIRYMEEYGLYDIAYSSQKANTGYTTTLYYYNEPFLFNAARGNYTDYTDLFHEIGHYVNYFYTQPDLLFGIGCNDLSELQSQGMEVMFLRYYDEIFGEEYADVIRMATVMNLVYSVIDGALYDEFQYRVYTEPDLTREKVQEIFSELYQAYGYQIYDGYETEWMQIEHTIAYPFYYISYSVSAISALEILEIAVDDSWTEATDQYLRAAALDGELYYFSEALEEIGMADIFDTEETSEIAEAVDRYLAGYED